MTEKAEIVIKSLFEAFMKEPKANADKNTNEDLSLKIFTPLFPTILRE
jgi:hypothetical protein